MPLRRVVALGLLALVAAAAPAGCGGEDEPAVPGVPPLVDAGAPAPGGSPDTRIELPPSGRSFGFSGQAIAFPVRRDDLPGQFRRTAQDALAAGANALRFPVPWAEVEPQPGQFVDTYLAGLSAAAETLEAAGGRLALVLVGAPAWASAEPSNPAAAPRDDPQVDQAFGRFAAHLARRFPRALSIETWNEPNAAFAWAPQEGGAERYLRLHRAAATAIREVAPGIAVLLGGIAGRAEDTDDVVRPQRYLKRLYGAGLRPEDYDGLAVHVYPGQGDGRSLGLGDGTEYAGTLADFREGYRWRDPDANVWVTETGLSTTGEHPVTPAEQGRGLLRLLSSLLSQPEVAGVFVHTLHEPAYAKPSDGERGFGVMTADGRPKPAYCAIQAAADAGDSC